MSKIDLYFIEYIKETDYYLFDKIPFTDKEILDMNKKTFTYSLFRNAYDAFLVGFKEFGYSINDGNLKRIATLKTNLMLGFIETKKELF